jgi:hypothetical protein
LAADPVSRFYDLPRLMAVEYAGSAYLFDSRFQDDEDEYASEYVVYRLPRHAAASLDGASWDALPGDAAEVGRVHVEDVRSDDTRRRFVGRSALDRLGLGIE